jgi:hypothetical protein
MIFASFVTLALRDAEGNPPSIPDSLRYLKK